MRSIETYVFSLFELMVLSVVLIWITLNLLAFRSMLKNKKTILNVMYSEKEIHSSTLVFFARFFVSFIILSKMEIFPAMLVSFHNYSFMVNYAFIVVALIWLPEIIALMLWGVIFAVFALAGLGASLFIDYLYFGDIAILWGKVGPISLIMIAMIILSFRYFSNYSIREIVKMAQKVALIRKVLLLSSVTYLLIGGGVFWRAFISSKIYKKYISVLLDKIENMTAAISVIIILLALPLQFPKIPLLVKILILINAPIAFTAVVILLAEKKFGAWKAVFEIYTEEFSAQSLILKDKIAKKNRKFLLVALIGNWAAIPIALYDVGSVMFWLLGDAFLVGIALLILGSRYISSMIEATREIIKEIRSGRRVNKLSTESSGQSK